MASAEVETHCYNKGCGKRFMPSENGPEACIHHPGEPIFHDALKGWSCCKKKTTDFTEFLNIRGCTKGLHNNQKPPEKPKPAPVSKEEREEVIVVEPPKPKQPTERPSGTEPLVRLPVTVGSSLKAALENLTVTTPEVKPEDSSVCGEIKEGTSCKNLGCKKTYSGVQSNFVRCSYHHGKPIFHEGMKYWSCCRIKTSDFNNFLEQEGCTVGDHLWVVKEDDTKKLVDCRYDWHQTGSHVVLSVYCKNAQPELSFVEVNQVLMNVGIYFNQGRNQFKKTITLERVIDPTKSAVTMLGSKCEVKLKKAEACSWKKYEVPPVNTETAVDNEISADH